MRLSALFCFVAVAAGQSNHVNFQGAYQNEDHAFRSSVPPGLTGYRMAAPAPNHGFAIDLEPNSAAFISVDGSYNVLDIKTAHGAAEENLDWIRDKGDVLGTPRYVDSKLGTLPTVEILVRDRLHKTGLVRTCAAIAALRDGSDIIYEIILDTSAARFEEDERVWRSIVRSFQITPLPK